MMREAARVSPDDAGCRPSSAWPNRAVRDFDAAERAYREAIRLDPRALSAYLELGLLLENLNRIDELAALVEAGKARGLAGPELGFIKAWALRRQGRFAEALPLAEATPETDQSGAAQPAARRAVRPARRCRPRLRRLRAR